MLGRVEKMPKKGFRSVTFSHKKVMGYFRFLFLLRPDFLPLCTLPYAFAKKTVYKKSFHFLFIESKVVVSKMRVLG